jgi:hypothetical protein
MGAPSLTDHVTSMCLVVSDTSAIASGWPHHQV